MNCSMPGFPVLHHLLELAQTHVHWVSDTIQPSLPLSSSSLAFSISNIRSFLMRQLFASDGQSIGTSASVLPINIQDWFPLGLTSLISLLSKRLSRVFSKPTVQKHQFYSAQLSLWPCMTRCTTTGKTKAFTRQTFVGKVISLLFNMLSRLAIAFLPRNKCPLILWLKSPSALILEPKKIKSLTVSIVSSSVCHKWCDWMPWYLFFECWVLSQLFHPPFSLSSRGSLVLLHFLPYIWDYWHFSQQSWFQLVLHPAWHF